MVVADPDLALIAPDLRSPSRLAHRKKPRRHWLPGACVNKSNANPRFSVMTEPAIEIDGHWRGRRHRQTSVLGQPPSPRGGAVEPAAPACCRRDFGDVAATSPEGSGGDPFSAAQSWRFALSAPVLSPPLAGNHQWGPAAPRQHPPSLFRAVVDDAAARASPHALCRRLWRLRLALPARVSFDTDFPWFL